MFLNVLSSAFYLLTSPVTTQPSTSIIRQHHLETAEGRTAFLINKLTPFATAADQLNREIQTLGREIEILSPTDDQAKILALTEQVVEKMKKLSAMMPTLNMALSIDEDFLQMEVIAQQTDPLLPDQQQVLERVNTLCNSLDNFRQE